MRKICRVDIKRSKEIYKRIRQYVRQLKASYPIREVYLYGSFAGRDINEGSDIDLLIVGDFEDNFFERIYKALSLTELPIEPLVYTPAEFDRMKRQKNPFLMQALKGARKI